jgi:chromosome segregation ATPase
MEDFKVIETQEDFDKAIQKRLAQKDREAEEKYKSYLSPEKVEALNKEWEEKFNKVNESLKEATKKMEGHDQIVSDLTKRATTAESSLLRSKVAHESGVPFELAERLVGTTEEELKADAEKLASFLTPKAAPPLRSNEPGGNNADAGFAQMLSQINQQFNTQ